MPHYFDFKIFEKINELEIRNLAGWQSSIIIEYAYSNFGKTEMYLYWRVKGTAHTFTITAKEFNQMSKGNPEEHFRQTLKVFRNDIIQWYEDGLPEEWMREYVYMFKNYITF